MPASEQGVAVSAHRYHLVPRVLCFVFAGDEVLIADSAGNLHAFGLERPIGVGKPGLYAL